MKILAICGSPKKGNTYSTLNFIKENYPDIDFKILNLKDANLKPCLGCYVCVKLGEDKCPLKDDREKIVKDMLDADGVLFASPVYTMQITSLMKNYFERVGYIDHRPVFYGKQAMLMAVCAGFGTKETNEYMEGMCSIFGFSIASKVGLKFASKSENEKAYNQKLTTEAFDKFIAKIKESKGKPPSITLTQLIYYNVFRTLSQMQKDMYKADYKFYKDKTEIPANAKVNPFKKMFANYMVRKITKDMMKNR
jgi:multimeric flavodoxin WrbA